MIFQPRLGFVIGNPDLLAIIRSDLSRQTRKKHHPLILQAQRNSIMQPTDSVWSNGAPRSTNLLEKSTYLYNIITSKSSGHRLLPFSRPNKGLSHYKNSIYIYSCLQRQKNNEREEHACILSGGVYLRHRSKRFP